MLRPHVDLMWDFGSYRAGLSASQVRFANGPIESKQIGLVWSANTDFRFVPRERIGSTTLASQRSGIGFDRVHGVAGLYHPRGNSRRVGGAPLDGRIGLVGARFEQAMNDHSYWGIEAAGAAGGGVAGYAEYLASLGTETGYAGGRLVLGGRLAAGMGGGGDIDTGGGLLLKGTVYGTVRLGRDLGLTLEAGLARAPQGSFKAVQTSASLNWILDDPSDVTAPGRVHRTEWIGGVEHYNAARRDGSTRSLQAVMLKLNRFITPSIYLSGQARSAIGGGAGGYSVGLIGVGAQTPIGRCHAGAEMLAGAAGGGGVDTGGGALVQPMAYLGCQISPSLSLRVGAGRIRSLRGPLDSSVVDASLAFTFGVGSRGYH